MIRTDCDVFSELSENLSYTVLISSKFAFCLAGTIGAALQWRLKAINFQSINQSFSSVGVAWLKHSNSKALFSFYYGLICLIGASYAALYGWEFARLRFPCFTFDFRVVLSIRTAGLSAIAAAHYLMVAIALERLYSSLRPENFEKIKSRHYGVIIATFIIFLSFFVTFSLVSDFFRLFVEDRSVVTIELLIRENSTEYTILMNGLLWTYIPSSLIFLVDWYFSFVKKSKRTAGEINVTYQRRENRDVISVLVPLEIANCFLAIFATIAQFVYMKMDPQATFSQRALFLEATALSPLYPLAFTAIFEWRLRVMRKRKMMAVRVSQASHDHFQEMHKVWETPAKSFFP